jgi:hypothetical protein
MQLQLSVSCGLTWRLFVYHCHQNPGHTRQFDAFAADLCNNFALPQERLDFLL